jgi:hypothetical protein
MDFSRCPFIQSQALTPMATKPTVMKITLSCFSALK